MSEIVANIGNDANWEMLYFNNFVADEADDRGAYFPILVDVPITTDRQLLRAYGANTEARAGWNLAFYINVYAVAAARTLVAKKSIVLVDWTLIEIPRLANSYALEIRVPYWHKKMQVAIQEFIGPISYTTEDKIDQAKGEILAAIG